VLVLPTGGKGIGVEANGSNFPFVAPSPDIVGLLADLWLAHEYRDVVLPLRVAWMQGFQAAFDDLPSGANLLIVDAAGETVFDSTAATGQNYYSKDWGPRLRVHEWLLPGAVCRAVQHRATANVVPPWPDQIVPQNGVLDERASELLAQRLLVLSEASSGVAVTGEVTLIGGWNVEIAPGPYNEPLRNTTLLTFGADPGGGQGRYPGCQTTPTGILTINGTAPDARGNFTLAADGCYYARQPVKVVAGKATPTPATLALGNDCGPCCDCDSFVNVQKAVLKVEADLRAVAAQAEATRDGYATNIARWNAAKECREQTAVSVTAATTGRIYADINATVCNVTPNCMVDTDIEIAPSTTPAGNWTVVPNTTYRSQGGKQTLVPYQLGTGNNTLVGFFDSIPSGSYGRIRTRIQWNYQMPAGTMLTVTGTATLLGDPANALFPQSDSVTLVMT
jgi:hypothetical protein